jgi:hypothetical protein
MTTEELIIKELRQLNPEQQQQVWEFINALPKPTKKAEISPLGKNSVNYALKSSPQVSLY